MTFLPIVARELRVAARRGSTYWLRTGAALLVLVLGTWVFLMMHNAPPKEIAPVLFGILAGTAVLYCLLAGVRSTADCLSAEKREGTLGLLFLTDLKGYDVVFGKLAATSVNALYGVLAVVPMLAIPLLMGGVAPAEFGRMALVAVNTLFFSHTRPVHLIHEPFRAYGDGDDVLHPPAPDRGLARDRGLAGRVAQGPASGLCVPGAQCRLQLRHGFRRAL